jgi:hypothetical protein
LFYEVAMIVSMTGGCVTFSVGRRIGLTDVKRVRDVLSTFTPFESAVVDLTCVAECDQQTVRALAQEVERVPFVRYRLGPTPARRRVIARWLRECEGTANRAVT